MQHPLQRVKKVLKEVSSRTSPQAGVAISIEKGETPSFWS